MSYLDGFGDGKSFIADKILTILSTNYIDKVKIYQINQLCQRHYKEPDYASQDSRTDSSKQQQSNQNPQELHADHG